MGQVAARGRKADGGRPNPAPELGEPPSHLREGTPPDEEGRESEAGRIPSQLSSQEAAHYPASLNSN